MSVTAENESLNRQILEQQNIDDYRVQERADLVRSNLFPPTRAVMLLSAHGLWPDAPFFFSSPSAPDPWLLAPIERTTDFPHHPPVWFLICAPVILQESENARLRAQIDRLQIREKENQALNEEVLSRLVLGVPCSTSTVFTGLMTGQPHQFVTNEDVTPSCVALQIETLRSLAEAGQVAAAEVIELRAQVAGLKRGLEAMKACVVCPVCCVWPVPAA